MAEDLRVTFLTQFGFAYTPSMASLRGGLESPEEYAGRVSLEKVVDVKADLFIGLSDSPKESTYTIKHPVLSRWAPIATGKYYFLENHTLGMATNAPSLLSIPWAFEQGFVDDLKKAVGGGRVARANR